MPRFSKVTFIPVRTDIAYGNYENETTRIETDFTINALKNIHKNYKKRIKCCTDGQILVISPGHCPVSYLTIQPESETCPVIPVEHICFETFTVDPGIDSTDDYLCEPIPPVEQVPFVLATRGVIFRQRGTPHFTTIGNAENYTN